MQTILAGLCFSLAGSPGLRAQTQALPAGVPAAPPGGVIASKLPDANGLHLGTGQDEAVAFLKKLYPGANDVRVTTNKEQVGTTWISHITAGNCASACDSLDVTLSPPPNPVQVIGIDRTFSTNGTTPPTMDTVVAGLRKKYGQELASVKAPIMAWAYDEQGQPANPQGPSNWSPADCAHLASFELPGPTPMAQILPRLVANPCDRGVFVRAEVGAATALQGVPVVTQLHLFLGEKSLEFRDGVAAQQYAEAKAASQQQQEMKKAQQQKAPTL